MIVDGHLYYPPWLIDLFAQPRIGHDFNLDNTVGSLFPNHGNSLEMVMFGPYVYGIEFSDLNVWVILPLGVSPYYKGEPLGLNIGGSF